MPARGKSCEEHSSEIIEDFLAGMHPTEIHLKRCPDDSLNRVTKILRETFTVEERKKLYKKSTKREQQRESVEEDQLVRDFLTNQDESLSGLAARYGIPMSLAEEIIREQMRESKLDERFEDVIAGKKTRRRLVKKKKKGREEQRSRVAKKRKEKEAALMRDLQNFQLSDIAIARRHNSPLEYVILKRRPFKKVLLRQRIKSKEEERRQLLREAEELEKEITVSKQILDTRSSNKNQKEEINASTWKEL